MIKNKKSWYDGKFYDKFIAPNQDTGFKRIYTLIPENSSVIDIGCGTGRLALQLANSCKSVTGVDISLKNINVAKTKLKSSYFDNVSFVHADANNLSLIESQKYDFTVFSYVLHEINDEHRLNLISKLKTLSNNIIISDYLVPLPKNLWGILTRGVEYLAGSDHYKNFIDYVNLGGIEYLVQKSGLKVIQEIKENSKTSHIVLLSK